MKLRYVGIFVAIVTLIITTSVTFRHFQSARSAFHPGGSLIRYYIFDSNWHLNYYFKIGEQGWLFILVPMDSIPYSPSQTYANLTITEKLASQVTFDTYEPPQMMYFSTTKSYWTNAPTVVEGPIDGKIIFNMRDIPSNPSRHSSYNWVYIRIKFTASRAGIFDIGSNFDGCGTWSLRQISSQSFVQYSLQSGGPLYIYDFSAGCMSVEGNPLNIIKTTYLKEGNCKSACSNSCKRQATFDAGEQVLTRLEIDEPDDSRTDYKIQDALPKTISEDVTYSFQREKDPFFCQSGTASASNGQIIFPGGGAQELLKGKNIIEYSYKI